jgi:hypothetical protein
MRGVVESAIRNMSAEERQAALREVTGQVVSMMSENERVDALTAIVGELVASVPAERLEEAFSRNRAGM